jgi:small subunit ribosomal protein S7
MRRNVQIKKKVSPDPVYNSVLVEKFTNLVMKDGKKNLARKVVYSLLEKLEAEHKKPALEVFEDVLDKARPSVILKARRVGGSNFQVPTSIEKERGVYVAMRWIINFARKRKGAPIVEDLVKECNDILAGQGEVLKKREDTHRMAEANNAFAHFR